MGGEGKGEVHWLLILSHKGTKGLPGKSVSLSGQPFPSLYLELETRASAHGPVVLPLVRRGSGPHRGRS